MSGKKDTGLVIEGGGMRGIYAAGVLDVFLENDIKFDGVTGVSAGAVHGCSYVSGQHGRSIRYYKKYCRDPRFVGVRNFLTTGDIVGIKFCYYDIPKKLDPFDYDAFYNSDTDFYVGCSNLETGKAEYLKVKDMDTDIDLLRASSSLPYVSKIVDWHGLKLMDGGCTDSIPVFAMHKKLGYKKIVVIQTRYRGYKKTSEYNPLCKIMYHKYPNFIKALTNRHIMYNREVEAIEKLEREEKIFVIRPENELKIGRINATPDELQEVYDIGRKDASDRLTDMEKWLKF